MANLDQLLDSYLAGGRPLHDPSVGVATVVPGPVTLRGVAEDAMAGAVVVGDDGLVTLVVGLEGWPDGLRGGRVVVDGTLGTVGGAPAGGLGSDGIAHHGGSGGGGRAVFDARWRRADDGP